MRRGLAIAALLLSAQSAQAARLDLGPELDIGKFIAGCWVNAAGSFESEAGRVALCFENGVVDAGDQQGAYAIRGEKLILTGPVNVAWVFGRTNIICDVGVKPRVRLGLFDCVGTDATALPTFLPDLLFTAQPGKAT